MKKTVSQKGMTLVALIITIVILLIMAVAAISTISDDKIVVHANEVVTKHNQSVVNEKAQIAWLEELLNDNTQNTIEPDTDDSYSWCHDPENEFGDLDIQYDEYDEKKHNRVYVCVYCGTEVKRGYLEYHSYNASGKCICGHKGKPNTTTRPNPS